MRERSLSEVKMTLTVGMVTLLACLAIWVWSAMGRPVTFWMLLPVALVQLALGAYLRFRLHIDPPQAIYTETQWWRLWALIMRFALIGFSILLQVTERPGGGRLVITSVLLAGLSYEVERLYLQWLARHAHETVVP